MKITTKVHTIFLLIGPTESGKTTFTKEVLMPQLAFQDDQKNFQANIHHLSSDDMRRELLGRDYDKYAASMMEASGVAFPYLSAKLEFLTSYPINAEFVIIDTIGLGEDFRQEIKAIADKKQYRVEAVVFDYPREDFYASERSKVLITKHVDRLKREVLPKLAKEDYAAIHRIKQKDFKKISVEVDDKEAYLATLLSNQQDYAVIGDVHESLLDLKKIVSKLGYQVTGEEMTISAKQPFSLILLGDWIDKGKQTTETIDFLYRNQQYFQLVLGNHENFVYRYLKGEIKGADQETIDQHFTSIACLKKEPAALAKFNHLVERSQPFLRRIGDEKQSFIVTHAPCHQQYLGKMDSVSLRNQRNFRLNREKSIQEQLQWLEEESMYNLPVHVFGHIAAKESYRIKNKYGIDTGAAYGNKLSAIKLFGRGNALISVSSEQTTTEALPNLFSRPKLHSWERLPDKERKRLFHMVRNKVQYLSGTMAPAAANSDQNDLESLSEALNYYRQQGVEQVVLEPKYMGSRANVYLFDKLEDCYAISRKGYKIRVPEIEGVFAELQAQFSDYMKKNKIRMLLLDGELLPWRAMGENLINLEYLPVAKGIETEVNFLKESKFPELFEQIGSQIAASDFQADSYHLSKKQLAKKYGDHQARQFRGWLKASPHQVPLQDQEKALDLYKQQIALYGKEAPLHFKPFDLLKIIYQNMEEAVVNQATSEIYQFLNKDEYLLLDIRSENAEEQAQDYFDQMTLQLQMEGIVIKPEHQKKNVAPFLKVRNEAYLTLIYGFTYRSPHQYQKLIQGKNIFRKLRTSIKEYELAQELLKLPTIQLTAKNNDYLNLLANLLFEMDKEVGLDPRL
ncbi:metallophosphoesterase [Candidatus Enterococcus murrayae]|uniref:Metallophosphoesterase n=1 Tax=Candidatus Enterococcus murrayae TaxID=2815321 RepID=A0ABS3HHX5_9ENTE|nr:metallophosphoesterase [Enterococcus sp. MJM16]MBO0453058.1 metallophosphoesterase [Enterococcus sp. MJM16]